VLPHVHSANVDLSAPGNSLGFANNYGYFRIWRELDEADFGQELILPLRTEFSSDKGVKSSIFGPGWRCPLMEANAYLKRERTMAVELICGKRMYLNRENRTSTTFRTEDKEWKGELRGQDFTLSRPDGWELRYSNGKIVRLRTDQNRVLIWIYEGDKIAAIKEEGAPNPVVKVETDARGIPVGLLVNDRRHQFTIGERPLIEHENNLNLVTGLEKTLASWTVPDGKIEEYHFQTGEGLIPSLILFEGGEKKGDYKWDPKTNFITSDGEWEYKIEGDGKNIPKLNRVNLKGEEEFFYMNNTLGISERKSLQDGHIITEIFKSQGPLYGKLRKVEKIENGSKRVVRQLTYDEKGKLTREMDSDGYFLVFNYDKKGELIGKAIQHPTDKAIVEKLTAKESELVKKLANITEKVARGNALQELGFFYINELRNPNKALELISQITDPLQQFNVKFHAVEGDQTLTNSQKAERLKALLKEYPQQSELLNIVISSKKE